MSLKVDLLTKGTDAWEESSQRTTSIESVGLLRAIAVGGAIFLSLSIPLMFNVQTKKYASEITAMNLKIKSVSAKIVTLKGSINSLLETYFPNARSVEIDGEKFYVRSK